MSNLSDLLPSGGGQNIVDFTASGTVASGKPVALNANGTVSQVAGVSESLGSAQTVAADSLENNVACYDSTNNRVVRATRNGSQSDAGYAYVSTVSGSTISSGTGVQFESGGATAFSTAFDSTNNKVLIVYKDTGDSSKGKAVVGTVDPSDNSISFGSIAQFESNGISDTAVSFNTSAGKFLITYRQSSGGDKGKAVVASISGTSVSYGSVVEFLAGDARSPTSVYDSTAEKHVVAYKDGLNSSYGTAVVGTISGTSVSFGTPAVFASATTDDIGAAYDSTNNKHVINFKDQGDSSHGKAAVGTVSGTSISFGTVVVYDSAGEASKNVTAFDASAGKIVVITVCGTALLPLSGTQLEQ